MVKKKYKYKLLQHKLNIIDPCIVQHSWFLHLFSFLTWADKNFLFTAFNRNIKMCHVNLFNKV